VVLLDQIHGFNPVGSLGNYINAAHGIEQILELIAGQLFVIDDERGDGHENQQTGKFDCRKGTRSGQFEKRSPGQA
jgi:hypothetical protein